MHPHADKFFAPNRQMSYCIWRPLGRPVAIPDSLACQHEPAAWQVWPVSPGTLSVHGVALSAAAGSCVAHLDVAAAATSAV